MHKRTPRGMARLRRDALNGDAFAAHNLACEYRILKRPRLAFRWWLRAAALGEYGDDQLELGYCLQHGVGVRRDRAAARRAYELALRTPDTHPYDIEEARYHLATLLLETRPKSRDRVVQLLRAANVDGDYPQASELLEQLSSTSIPATVCHCRRFLSRSLGGSAQCALHRQSRNRRSARR